MSASPEPIRKVIEKLERNVWSLQRISDGLLRRTFPDVAERDLKTLMLKLDDEPHAFDAALQQFLWRNLGRGAASPDSVPSAKR